MFVTFWVENIAITALLTIFYQQAAPPRSWLRTDREADEETVDPATLNAWDTATLENIHDLTEKGTD